MVGSFLEAKMQETTEFLRSVIFSLAAEREVLTGSLIGSHLKKQYPGVKLRGMYGGLRQFIELHCQDLLSRIGTQGADDVYRSMVPTIVTTRTTRSNIERIGLWRAFTNPRIPFHLGVKLDTGELCLVKVGLSPPEGNAILTKSHLMNIAQFAGVFSNLYS